jgi:hypothetical protein
MGKPTRIASRSPRGDLVRLKYMVRQEQPLHQILAAMPSAEMRRSRRPEAGAGVRRQRAWIPCRTGAVHRAHGAGRTAARRLRSRPCVIAPQRVGSHREAWRLRGIPKMKRTFDLLSAFAGAILPA